MAKKITSKDLDLATGRAYRIKLSLQKGPDTILSEIYFDEWYN